MCTICDMRDRGDWVAAVTQLGNKLESAPSAHHLSQLLLGRKSLLLEPLHRRGDPLPSFRDIRACSMRLLEEPVQQGLLTLYRATSPDLKDQVRNLLQGTVLAQLSAVVFYNRKTGYEDHAKTLWSKAARAFDDAFPDWASPAAYGFLTELDGMHRANLMKLLEDFLTTEQPQAISYLMIRRIVASLLAGHNVGLNTRDVRSTPALLYHPTRGGSVHHIMARRCKEGAGAWYPDPLSLGLVALDAEFLKGIADAWKNTLNLRPGSNKSYRIEFAEHEIRALCISGASLGASIAAVIRATSSGDELKSDICVDATLTSGGHVLGGVKHLDDKLPAAASAGIKTVIVASGQSIQAQSICQSLGLELDIIGEELLEDAYAHLVHTPATLQPPVPVVDDVEPDDTIPASIGGHRIVRHRLWEERFGEAHWVHIRGDSRRPAILQVVHPPATSAGHLKREVEMAVDRFQGLPTAAGCLVPTSIETADGDVLVLYERPRTEDEDSWCRLSSLIRKREKTRSDSEPLFSLFQLTYVGESLGGRLSTMHQHGLAHGEVTADNVLLQDLDGRQIVWLKNSWATYLPSLAAEIDPDEETEDEENPITQDSYAIGALLFRMATGREPDQNVLDDNANSPGDSQVIRDAVVQSCDQRWANEIHDTVYEAIRECLLPWPRLRPSCDAIWRMLHLTIVDPDLMGGFTEYLDGLIQAGQRLFYVETEDLESLEQGLTQLAGRRRRVRLKSDAIPTDQVEYRLIIAEEDVGLRGAVRFQWIPSDQVHNAFLSVADDPENVLPPTRDDVAHYNFACMLEELNEFHTALRPHSGVVPILLIHGIMETGPDWWDFGPAARRHLTRINQEQGPAPVVIVAGRHVSLEVELDRQFVPVPQPPPPVSTVFTWIRAAGRRMKDEDFKDEDAVRLATHMYPCSKPKLDQALRICELQRGRIDDTLLKVRSAERKRMVEQTGVARYTAIEDLATLDLFGLPPQNINLEDENGFVVPGRRHIEHWAQKVGEVHRLGLPLQAQRMISIDGPSGCGKRTLAECLAHRLEIPLIEIDLNACLKSNLGGTERSIVRALYVLGDIRRAVVLIPDADRSLIDTGEDQITAAALARASGLIKEWITSKDAAEKILILTSQDFSVLPPDWRLHLQWRLRVAEPVGDHMAEYRSAVFTACLKARGLSTLAERHSFISRLALETDPVLGIPHEGGECSVITADSRLVKSAERNGRRMVLRAPCDIDVWICETLLFHAENGDPTREGFWLDALQGTPADVTTMI